MVIFAYDLNDPLMSNDVAIISYHGTDDRGSRILPLQSYANTPSESKFDGLDYFDFRLSNVRHLKPRRTSSIIYSLISVHFAHK